MADDAPGWDSIERAFAAVYGDQTPLHRAPPPQQQPPVEGGILNGISAYRGEDRWHLVTFGLSDVFGRGPVLEEGVSGWGHELTLLVPAADEPPLWAFELLMAVARTERAVGRPLHAGARLAPGAPVDGAGSGLTAVALREDPVVTPADAPTGTYAFLQLVGITSGEHALMGRVGTALVLEKLAARDPLLRTDPSRA